MKNLRKKSISLVLIFTLLMAVFMPTMVNAVSTITQGNKIVNTTTSETLTIDDEEHNSTIYAGEIKKDGVTVLNYLYSDDVTRSAVLFDNIRKALSNPYSDLVPSIINVQTESGLKELSVSTLNGMDLTTISNGWTNASNIATQVYGGTNNDIVNSNMYDVDNGFKTEVDNNATERASIDNPVENNKRIISHLGTTTEDDVNFSVVEGDLMEVHNVDLVYLSEATTVIYTSVNVTTETTPTTPTKITGANITLKAPKVGDEVKKITKNDGYGDYDAQDVAPAVSTTTEGLTVSAFWVKGLEDLSEESFYGTFEKDTYYYALIDFEAEDGYELPSTFPDGIKINGVAPDEVFAVMGGKWNHCVAKIKATEETTPTETTYEYIDNTANQKYTINENDTLTFRINADYSLFENGGKVYVDDKLVSTDNYSSKSGSTIITFTKDYMSSLSEGEHTLKVAFNNGGTATTKFTVAKASTTTEETTPTSTTETAKEITTSNNPKTGDNIITIFSIFAIATLGAFTTIKLNKNRKVRKH